MLECVVNVSEGRRPEVIDALADAGRPGLLDVHSDADHHRTVLSLAGEDAVRAVTQAAVRLIDLSAHRGVHPRFGAVDVVPFVPLGRATLADAVLARDRFARWAASELGVPCFLYGPERSLPEVRRQARAGSPPDVGPARPHQTAGTIAVGARPALVAYNVWLATPDLAVARRIATELRSPAVRTLAFALGDAVQVSANLVSPLTIGPAEFFDAVAAHAPVARGELVGLLPSAVLDRIASSRWPELGLTEEATVEARLARTGLSLD